MSCFLSYQFKANAFVRVLNVSYFLSNFGLCRDQIETKLGRKGKFCSLYSVLLIHFYFILSVIALEHGFMQYKWSFLSNISKCKGVNYEPLTKIIGHSINQPQSDNLYLFYQSYKTFLGDNLLCLFYFV